MKIKLIIAIGLLSLSHTCFSGIIFNNVPVSVTIEGINGRFDKDNFSITIKGTNNIDDYPTFRKTVYGWFRQRTDLVDHEGSFPALIRKFIPSGQDVFTFSTAQMAEYLEAINSWKPEIKRNSLIDVWFSSKSSKDRELEKQQEYVGHKLHFQSLVENLKTDLATALFTTDLIYNAEVKSFKAHNPAGIWGWNETITKDYTQPLPASTLSPMSQKDYNLYTIDPSKYEQTQEEKDNTTLETEKHVAHAYLAIQKFCSALGVPTPSIRTYTSIIATPLLGAATLGSAYLWYKSKNQ